jgi:hypothetical protein
MLVLNVARAPLLLLVAALLGLVPMQAFALPPGDCSPSSSSRSGLGPQDGARDSGSRGASSDGSCAPTHCCCEGVRPVPQPAAALQSCACSDPMTPPASQPPLRWIEVQPTAREVQPLRLSLDDLLHPQCFAILEEAAVPPPRPVRTTLGVRLL